MNSAAHVHNTCSSTDASSQGSQFPPFFLITHQQKTLENDLWIVLGTFYQCFTAATMNVSVKCATDIKKMIRWRTVFQWCAFFSSLSRARSLKEGKGKSGQYHCWWLSNAVAASSRKIVFKIRSESSRHALCTYHYLDKVYHSQLFILSLMVVFCFFSPGL